MTARLAPGTAISTEGHLRTVGVTLHESLGGRVLVNLDATPVPATQGGVRDGRRMPELMLTARQATKLNVRAPHRGRPPSEQADTSGRSRRRSVSKAATCTDDRERRGQRWSPKMMASSRMPGFAVMNGPESRRSAPQPAPRTKAPQN